jgi:DNA-binding MarR family transcriptional regulator
MQEYERRIRQTINVLQLLKPLSQAVTVNTAIVFLTVGSRPGTTVGELQKTLGLPPTSTARAISILYKTARGVEGLDLIETRVSPRDLRIKNVYLTPKGQRLWNQIIQLVGGTT